MPWVTVVSCYNADVDTEDDSQQELNKKIGTFVNIEDLKNELKSKGVNLSYNAAKKYLAEAKNYQR